MLGVARREHALVVVGRSPHRPDARHHQLEAPLYLGIWAKQGSKGVKYDAENTGYGFRSEVAWDSYISAQPTSCQMKRPG